MNNIPRIGVPLLLTITFGLLLLTKSIWTIDPGEAGVLYKLFDGGVVTDQPPKGEGIHLIAPWNSLFVYEVRQQEVFEKMNVLSSNGLDIKLEASAWFQPDYANLGKLHQERHKTIVISNVPPQLFLKNLNKAFSAVGTVKFLTVKQGRAEVHYQH